MGLEVRIRTGRKPASVLLRASHLRGKGIRTRAARYKYIELIADTVHECEHLFGLSYTVVDGKAV